MEFCPRCGSIILVSEGKAICAKCRFRPRGKVKIQASEKIERKGNVLIIKENDLSTYPVVEIRCPSCMHKKAYFWTLQTRAADESETKFYKCTKCEHTWREYK